MELDASQRLAGNISIVIMENVCRIAVAIEVGILANFQERRKMENGDATMVANVNKRVLNCIL